jgi:uncharacterized membrane-anchored protein
VTVEGNVATIELPPGWRYLHRAEARYVVEQQWGNRPNHSTLGLILPPAGREWGGIVVSYDASGHVSDAGAGDIDFDRLLKDMQEDAVAGNHGRRKRGERAIELLGWAEAPHYDAARKTLRWGKLLRVENQPQPILNYEGRVLGADGALVLQGVADPVALEAVAAGMAAVLAGTQLAPAKRYAGHDPGVHRVAPYGIERLIAGKEVRRVGLFQVLRKPVLVVAVAVLSLSLLRRRSSGRLAPASA